MTSKAKIAEASIRRLDDPFSLAAHAAGEIAGAREPEAPPRHRPRSNALGGDEHPASLGDALEEIALIVGRTAGPHGSSALVQDRLGQHFATKDGYTVLKHIEFVQNTSRMAADIVRSAARKVVRRVGDGSTTSVLMANSLFRSFRAPEFAAFPPGALQAAMGGCSELIADEVRARARMSLDTRELAAVATIAANNDPKAGAMVAAVYEVYGPHANIYVGVSPGEEGSAQAVPGFRVLRGMADECFANEAEPDAAKPSVCSLSNARVMVWGGTMGEQDFILCAMPAFNIAANRAESFVVVANGFDPKVIERVREIKRKSPAVGILMVDHAMASRRSKARLGDLAAVTNADYIEPLDAPMLKDFNDPSPEAQQVREAAYQMTGVAQSVRSTASETVFVTGSLWPEAERRAEGIEAQIVQVDTNNHSESMQEELEELKARVRAIRGTEVAILAGGATEQEKVALQYLLDDAALACAAALRTGVVEGLGMTALRLLNGGRRAEFEAALASRIEAKTRVGPGPSAALAALTAAATERAYRHVLETVFANARIDPGPVITTCLATGRTFDLLSNEYLAPEEANINPAATDIEVVRGAMSIAALFATSDQVLLLHPVMGGGQD
jgi:chaperonin GroEL